jgi:MSHA biogenesis protein MshJ
MIRPARNPSWRNALASLERRVDALSLRERVILFVTFAAIGVAVFDHYFLSGAQQPRQARAAALAREAVELTQMRAQLISPVARPGRAPGLGQASSAAADPQLQLQARLADARQRLANLNNQLRAGNGEAGVPVDLPALLTRVLKKHDQLTLLRLAPADGAVAPGATTSAAPGTAASPAAAGFAAQAASAIHDATQQGAHTPGPAAAQVLAAALPASAGTAAGSSSNAPAPGDGPARWQSVDLSLSGPYLSLLAYLRTLEAQLPGLRWGALDLLSEPGRTPVLTLRLTLESAL